MHHGIDDEDKRSLSRDLSPGGDPGVIEAEVEWHTRASADEPIKMLADRNRSGTSASS